MSKKKSDDLLIKKVYEYTIDEKTYKGHYKILKVAKIEESNDWGNFQTLVLENGQRLSTSLLHDLYRDKSNLKYFKDDLRFKFKVYTIVKIPNIKEVFEEIKETAIECLVADINLLTKDIKKNESVLEKLQESLKEKTNCLKLLEGK